MQKVRELWEKNIPSETTRAKDLGRSMPCALSKSSVDSMQWTRVNDEQRKGPRVTLETIVRTLTFTL